MKWVAFLLALALFAISRADESIYTDQLNNGWQNWSWASINLASTAYVHSGKCSIAVTETGASQALYLESSNDQSTSGFEGIEFWINGGAAGGQQLQVQGVLDGGASVTYILPELKANTWQKVVVPMIGVGAGSVDNFSGFWIQDRSGNTEPTWYVDDISLLAISKPTVNRSIYYDSLMDSWTSTSTASVNLANKNPVHSGHDSIAVTETGGNQSLSLNSPLEMDGSQYKTLTFSINGGSAGGQKLQVTAIAAASRTSQATLTLPAFTLSPLLKNQWQQVTIPLQMLGVDDRGDFDGVMISDQTGTAQPTYYVDDITLTITPPVNPLSTITISTSNPAPISPYIYGVNSTDFAHLGPGFTIARQGGNRLTAYNWTNNASNAGSDYLYQNDDLMGATNQAGWAGLTFIQAAYGGGATPLLTVPIVDYVAADKDGGGDIRNTPNYITARLRQNLWSKPGGNYIYPPDTTIYQVYEDEFMNYIMQFATPQFPLMFDLDNEPDLWSSTHPEVHPVPVTYAELITRSTNYATSIKKVYPGATVFGPVSYGWYGYRTLQGATDANGRDFLTFYLQSMSAAGKTAGKRLLDVLDLHWYPEATGDGIRITGEGDSDGLAAARIQAARSLWDPTYVEDSWITQSLGGQGINLVPGTEGLISANYPGTKLSFSEYNYGGGNSISGAIAQADVLGVFGRYGVYASANWGLSATETSELAGFQSFINYDRAGSKFGNLELNVKGETPAANSVYAALDSTNAKRLTLVVINKTNATTPFNIDIPNFAVLTSTAYIVTAGNYTKPLKATVMNLNDGIAYTAAPLSITTIELKSR